MHHEISLFQKGYSGSSFPPSNEYTDKNKFPLPKSRIPHHKQLNCDYNKNTTSYKMTFVQELEAASQNSKAFNIFLWTVFAYGILKLVPFVLRILSTVLDLFVLPPVSYEKYGCKLGDYAVVTGASDGIGKEFAFQLASRGFNMVLISRTESKLVTLKKEIEDKYHNKVEILAIDIAKDSQDNYNKIYTLCKDLPISVLVNNVGQSHSIPVPFLATEEEEMRNIITINNTATLMITQIIAPIITKTVKAHRESGDKKQKGKRGLILTMGSFGGLIPTPLLATYSGSKAFLQNWSSSLAGELSKDNIDVEFILSYLVTSAMSKVRRSSMMIPNPRTFVKATLKNVGRRCGAQERYATITPYWSHALYHLIIEETFGVYSNLVNEINYKFHKSIRMRAVRKALREAKQQ